VIALSRESAVLERRTSGCPIPSRQRVARTNEACTPFSIGSLVNPARATAPETRVGLTESRSRSSRKGGRQEIDLGDALRASATGRKDSLLVYPISKHRGQGKARSRIPLFDDPDEMDAP